jgi:hypothetical protein
MINFFVIEPGIGQEGKFIHERLFSFPPDNGFVLQRQYPGNYSMIFLAGLRSGSPYQILTTRELVWPPTKKPEALAT